MNNPMTRIDDTELLKRLSEGDQNAFAAIFSKYYKGLVMYCNSFITDIDECEDIVQNIFVELWESRRRLNIASLRNYLLRCVRNDSYDAIKHKKIVETYSARFLIEFNPYSNSLDNYLMYNELKGLVQMILDQLDPKAVEAFKMSRWDGRKYDEIAQIMNVSRRTIEVRVTRVVKELRERLKIFFPNTN